MPTSSVSYPHPVLGLADDLSGKIVCDAPEVIVGAETTTVSFAKLKVENSTIEKMLTEQRAAWTLRVNCSATWMRRSFASSGDSLVAELPTDGLLGEVKLALFICATRRVTDYRPAGLNEDYGPATFSIEPADVLGLGGEFSFIVDREFDAMEGEVASIMQVRQGSHETGPFEVNFDSQRIEISLSARDWETYGRLKNNRATGILHSGLVLPVLVEAIERARRNDPQALEDPPKWRVRLQQMLELNGISSAKTPIRAAQELLKSPFERTGETLDRFLREQS